MPSQDASHLRTPPPLPYMTEVGVIALVPDVWGGSWQVRHHVLTRLGRYFHVVWCNPARWWRRFWRHSTPPPRRGNPGLAVTPGLSVYDPGRWLPAIGRPRFLGHWTMRQRLRRAESMLRNRDCRKIILYIWRPQYEPALDLVNHDLSCYHIDDEYSFSDVERPIDQREARLIARVDQVFIHSPGLFEKKGGINPNTSLVPNGVDYERHAKMMREPSDLAPIAHPRIGYTGVIKNTLDWDLILDLTRQHPDWHFVFVGPRKPWHRSIDDPIQHLSSRRNVHFLGAKSIEEIPAYQQHMDVCILPYRHNSHMQEFGYPLKLHEYLASGSPVVGTPLRSLQAFASIIALARTPEEWSQGLAEMLVPTARSIERVQARRDVARQHDWDVLVKRIAHTLCARLSPSYLERVQTMTGAESTDPAMERSASQIRASESG